MQAVPGWADCGSRHRVAGVGFMQVRKLGSFETTFESTTDLLERILEGGIVVSPVNWLDLVERGMRERRMVIDSSEVDGIRLAG